MSGKVKVLRTACLFVLAGLSLVMGINFSTDVYQKSETKRAQRELAIQLSSATTKDQVIAVLGPPSRVVDAGESLQLARQFAGSRLEYERYRSYPQAMVYFRGLWIYFVFMDATNRLADCLVVMN